MGYTCRYLRGVKRLQGSPGLYFVGRRGHNVGYRSRNVGYRGRFFGGRNGGGDYPAGKSRYGLKKCRNSKGLFCTKRGVNRVCRFSWNLTCISAAIFIFFIE